MNEIISNDWKWGFGSFWPGCTPLFNLAHHIPRHIQSLGVGEQANFEAMQLLNSPVRLVLAKRRIRSTRYVVKKFEACHFLHKVRDIIMVVLRTKGNPLINLSDVAAEHVVQRFADRSDQCPGTLNRRFRVGAFRLLQFIGFIHH